MALSLPSAPVGVNKPVTVQDEADALRTALERISAMVCDSPMPRLPLACAVGAIAIMALVESDKIRAHMDAQNEPLPW